MILYINRIISMNRDEVKNTYTLWQQLLRWIKSSIELQLYQYQVTAEFTINPSVGEMISVTIKTSDREYNILFRVIDRQNHSIVLLTIAPLSNWFSHIHFKSASYASIGKSFGESTAGSIDSGDIN